jgi:hypothetical protein
MRTRLAFLALLSIAAAAHVRVISYAPYSDRVAVPAVQNRINRHFVLFEQTSTNSQPGPLVPMPPYAVYPPGQVVLYDSKAEEEPRIIFPQDGSSAAVNIAAVREDQGRPAAILIQTSANFQANNPTLLPIWLLSVDGGATWRKVPLPSQTISMGTGSDTGGPFARGRYSSVRIGTREVPFVVAVDNGVVAITGTGSVTQLIPPLPPPVGPPSPFNSTVTLAGSDREGKRFLVQTNSGIVSVDLNGVQNKVMAAPSLGGFVEGWITPGGAAYIEQTSASGNVVLWYAKDGAVNPVAASWDGAPNAQPPINSSWVFFAVPTADYSGAWIMKRGGSRPSSLYLHTPSAGLVPQWQDVTAPEVEALHSATSGTKVLIQVHRPRQTIDQLLFKDPALAVWHVGDLAPRSYDELFLSETTAKGFVHLDVDAVEGGDPFVFDSGAAQAFFPPGPILSPAPPGGGGSDVVQEWGVVRASLAQKLMLPGVGRTPGAFGSNWSTDVTLYNPSGSAINVALSFLPNNLSADTAYTLPLVALALQAYEIRRVPDILSTLFQLDDVTGALYVSPPIGSAINVTSRTYNKSGSGTYGFTMNGIDIFTAAGPRFPLTFSGAFQGSNFRTNVFLADVSGHGADVNATAAGSNGNFADAPVAFAGSQQMQVNGVAPLLGLSLSDTGALTLQPNRGSMIASVFVVDNRTNDPTFFPPDIPASVMRTIPAIGHLDGANGSKFRSDLYLFNNSSQAKTLNLQAKLWDVPENPTTLPLTLLPHEARVIRDVLLNAFGKTGIARLRFTIQGSTNDTSVRVTSRTYTIDPSGGTYGFLMPPLNSFQSGGAGDTLEILGASLDPGFRTNLGLVDLTAWPGPGPARARVDIIDDAGHALDSFEVSIPSAGGMQIDNLFHARGLPDSGKPVLLRISTIEGMIGAYAAIVDNVTNDPAYVAANLAAKQ